jgi:hypothetical protein
MAGLEWIADGEVLDDAVHSNRIRGGTCWVAPDEQRDSGSRPLPVPADEAQMAGTRLARTRP